MIYENILQDIGNTPLVRISRMNPNKNVAIYAKIEGNNPTGSVKDRIALKMIEQAEAEGTLVRGKTIIEPTSGNTGIALAMIGVVKGYDVEIVMSTAVSEERKKMIQAFGATITLTEADLGTDGAIVKARELETNKRKNRLFCLLNRNFRNNHGSGTGSQGKQSRNKNRFRPSYQRALYTGIEKYGRGNSPFVIRSVANT